MARGATSSGPPCTDSCVRTVAVGSNACRPVAPTTASAVWRPSTTKSRYYALCSTTRGAMGGSPTKSLTRTAPSAAPPSTPRRSPCPAPCAMPGRARGMIPPGGERIRPRRCAGSASPTSGSRSPAPPFGRPPLSRPLPDPRRTTTVCLSLDATLELIFLSPPQNGHNNDNSSSSDRPDKASPFNGGGRGAMHADAVAGVRLSIVCFGSPQGWAVLDTSYACNQRVFRGGWGFNARSRFFLVGGNFSLL